VRLFVYIDVRRDTNNVFYVGQGDEWRHRNYHPKARNKHHASIVDKYGMIRFVVFSSDDPKEIDDKEIEFIARQPRQPVSDETRAKLSLASKTRPPITEETRAKMKGRVKSPEECAKLSARTISLEARANMSAAAKKRKASPETRAKMSASQKLRRERQS
jgi:hypothetical protein